MRRSSVAAMGLVLLCTTTAGTAAQEADTPTATSDVLPGVTLSIVEVAPGVHRVVDDGMRDLVMTVEGYPAATVDFTPDGDVWLSGSDVVYRLGDESTSRRPEVWSQNMEVAPDGSLWAIVDGNSVGSFDGRTWTKQAGPTGDDLTLEAIGIGPDGTVWVTAREQAACSDAETSGCMRTVLIHVEEDGTMTTVDGWADVYEGDVAFDELTVGPDGDVWLIGMERWDGPAAEALLRFDGERWDLVPGPDGFVNQYSGHSMAFGPDGELWVHTEYSPDRDGGVGGLARFDDPVWTSLTEAEGMQEWGGQGFIAVDLLAIGPDGSVWVNGAPHAFACGGVGHYDGSRWTSYLSDACIHDLAIAPDGSAWVWADLERVGSSDPSWQVGLHVIDPETVAEPHRLD